MFKKILVCLDGSYLAEQILPFATAEALKFEGEIVLFRAYPENHYISVALPGFPSLPIETKGKEQEMAMAAVESETYLKGVAEDLLAHGGHDLILSIGQVVPHEVIGMANYNKNLFVGTGGTEGIHKSHFLGAVYGMEKLMGQADNPVRRLLNYASDHFIKHLPVVYVLTVIGRDGSGRLVMRGLFIGDDEEVFLKAAALSAKVNFDILDEPLRKVVVFLDPAEFKSTWLGNKSIYRTRMAIASCSFAVRTCSRPVRARRASPLPSSRKRDPVPNLR